MINTTIGLASAVLGATFMSYQYDNISDYLLNIKVNKEIQKHLTNTLTHENYDEHIELQSYNYSGHWNPNSVDIYTTINKKFKDKLGDVGIDLKWSSQYPHYKYMLISKTNENIKIRFGD